MRESLYVVPALVLALVALAPAGAELPELIPLEVIFGNPVKAAPLISPDGTRLSYLAPSDGGVLNVWVQTLGQDDDRMVTNDRLRGIRNQHWAEDSRRILYLQDIGGDEDWHVYAADLETGVVRDLTPFQDIRAENLLTDRDHPDEILVGLNLRDRTLFDMYRVDLATGAVVLDTQNPGDVLGWLADRDFQIRAAYAQSDEDGSTTLRVRDAAGRPWRDLLHWPFGERGEPVEFAPDGRSVVVKSTLGSDTMRLVRMDLESGRELEVLAAHPRADAGAVLLEPASRAVQAVEFDYLKPEWELLDDSIAADFEALTWVHDGLFTVESRDRADSRWIVGYDVDDGPIAFYGYDRRSRKAEFLFANRPALEAYALAPMKAVVMRARDGLEMVSYLTLPVGVDPRNLPLVLNPHGGPWGRDTWGYDPWAQWLANRGYAVLQVNFRGSEGFGKAFLNAGDGEWGREMQDDLSDAVRWAIEQGIADPKKVAIMGGSYGGYATLAGLTFTPDLYACGVDLVGPSHIKTLFRAIPPYWKPFRKELILRVGDVENDEALNRRISPFFHSDNIRVPLLVGQGANDPRVNIAESKQIVEAMRAKGLPVTYVVYPDEGHGFARPENRMDFFGRADDFLAECLGGRAEPRREVSGSTAELR